MGTGSMASGSLVTAPASGADRLRVLVVEDDDTVAEGLKLLFDQDYDVDVALGGRSALDRLLGERYDAVLCDLMMPGMSGIQLFHALRAAAPGLERRLVFMTGGAFTPDAEAFLAQVGNPRLEKPFDFASADQLLRRVAANEGASSPA
jgi:CheY-like chemotaxis protein